MISLNFLRWTSSLMPETWRGNWRRYKWRRSYWSCLLWRSELEDSSECDGTNRSCCWSYLLLCRTFIESCLSVRVISTHRTQRSDNHSEDRGSLGIINVTLGSFTSFFWSSELSHWWAVFRVWTRSRTRKEPVNMTGCGLECSLKRFSEN